MRDTPPLRVIRAPGMGLPCSSRAVKMIWLSATSIVMPGWITGANAADSLTVSMVGTGPTGASAVHSSEAADKSRRAASRRWRPAIGASGWSISTHAPVAKTLSFPDHYSYGEVDALKLMQMADAGGLRLVTTEKDFVRLAGKGGALAKLRERVEPFHVILEFENPTAITEMIGEAVRNHALARSD